MMTPERWEQGQLSQAALELRPGERAAFDQLFHSTYGNSGRNVLRAPGLVNLDFLVGRKFP
ncbi:MAG: hypothetical protein H0T77_07555 [Pyrinomonadaceae bacterium]|nr:hypothetical protein [Pyrinomonadaceae bacterium]